MNRERHVRIAGPASEEFTEAVRWYETRRPGLGAELYDAVNATEDPNSRRMLVAGFPYHVVYRLEHDEIVILAIAHMKRRPGFWKQRN